MFNLLKNLLEKASNDWQGAGAAEQHWQQAGLNEAEFIAVVLMLQLSHADFDSAEAEQQLVQRYLSEEYQLTPEHTNKVFAQAQQMAADSTCLHAYTSKLKSLTEPQRIAVLDQLWKVAYADGNIDPHEDAMLRKVADLLFIRHSDFIQSKLANKPT
ncbi:TerB family tellurite resistance protein [Rheinheimera sp. UJ51]|uniref:tellurite resistance TerB family protein n=1 Tax=Rheinheimera sp. UJ51 TaxID=2892446 RepID=UPI001E492827|nr:TerB family tellurite resistance protein [Rheinheimera sp. UJ51]MCC5453086.1 TerB family tellurite resistance protein [Rheinheimera sp. UJ51]